jgi:hypothetical protein
MTDDQQLAWDLLSGNHRKLAHLWGQELLELSKKRGKKQFHARADECLSITLSWPVEARSRAVKTWLSTYRVPFDPGRMPHMDQFHKTTGDFVIQNARNITPYALK